MVASSAPRPRRHSRSALHSGTPSAPTCSLRLAIATCICRISALVTGYGAGAGCGAVVVWCDARATVLLLVDAAAPSALLPVAQQEPTQREIESAEYSLVLRCPVRLALPKGRTSYIAR